MIFGAIEGSSRGAKGGETTAVKTYRARARASHIEPALHLMIVDYTKVHSMVSTDESKLATMGGKNGLQTPYQGECLVWGDYAL